MTRIPLRTILIGETLGRALLAARATWHTATRAAVAVQRWAAVAAVAVLTVQPRRVPR